jgi:hypothetical protein
LSSSPITHHKIIEPIITIKNITNHRSKSLNDGKHSFIITIIILTTTIVKQLQQLKGRKQHRAASSTAEGGEKAANIISTKNTLSLAPLAL